MPYKCVFIKYNTHKRMELRTLWKSSCSYMHGHYTVNTTTIGRSLKISINNRRPYTFDVVRYTRIIVAHTQLSMYKHRVLDVFSLFSATTFGFSLYRNCFDSPNCAHFWISDCVSSGFDYLPWNSCCWDGPTSRPRKFLFDFLKRN